MATPVMVFPMTDTGHIATILEHLVATFFIQPKTSWPTIPFMSQVSFISMLAFPAIDLNVMIFQTQEMVFGTSG